MLFAEAGSAPSPRACLPVATLLYTQVYKAKPCKRLDTRHTFRFLTSPSRNSST